jgi:hypothetical protein
MIELLRSSLLLSSSDVGIVLKGEGIGFTKVISYLAYWRSIVYIV